MGATRGRGCDRPPRQPRCPSLRFRAVRLADRIPGSPDGRREFRRGNCRECLHGRVFGGQVHRRARHTRHLQQCCVDAPCAGGAGHAFNLECEFGGGDLIAGLAHCSGQNSGCDSGIALGRCLLGRQIDRGFRDAGNFPQRLLETCQARGAGHATDLKVKGLLRDVAEHGWVHGVVHGALIQRARIFNAPTMGRSSLTAAR